MKLINSTTKEVVTVGSKLTVVKGCNKGHKTVVCNIVLPTEDEPKGFIHGDQINETYRVYYPYVLNCEWSK